jgi:hypothetical protein
MLLEISLVGSLQAGPLFQPDNFFVQTGVLTDARIDSKLVQSGIYQYVQLYTSCLP